MEKARTAGDLIARVDNIRKEHKGKIKKGSLWNKTLRRVKHLAVKKLKEVKE